MAALFMSSVFFTDPRISSFVQTTADERNRILNTPGIINAQISTVQFSVSHASFSKPPTQFGE